MSHFANVINKSESLHVSRLGLDEMETMKKLNALFQEKLEQTEQEYMKKIHKERMDHEKRISLMTEELNLLRSKKESSERNAIRLRDEQNQLQTKLEEVEREKANLLTR